MESSPSVHLLSLPQELRDQIYGYLLPYKTPIRVRTQPRRCYRIYQYEFGRLRCTCRQIWHETSEFLYANSEIRFVEGIREISQGVTNFFRLVGEYIQTVQLRPHFLDMDRGYIREPHARSYRPSFRPSIGSLGRSCQQEILRTILQLGSLPRLHALEILPYGGDLADFLEPMQFLYQCLIALSGKPTLRSIKVRIKFKISGDASPGLAWDRDSLILRQLLGREPSAAELPDERGYSTITEFPLCNRSLALCRHDEFLTSEPIPSQETFRTGRVAG